MSRTITSHVVNPANDKIAIEVMDEPGSGGANHVYDVRLPGWTREPSSDGKTGASKGCWLIEFQNGPIAEAGVNGLTHEVLLAILIDRLQGFQKGPFAGRDNAVALTKLEEAAMWLAKRTRERMARGVEGTHKV